MSSHSRSDEATTFFREVIVSVGLFGIIFLTLVLLPSRHPTAPGGGGAEASSVMAHVRATRAMQAHTPQSDLLEQCATDVHDEMAVTASAAARLPAQPTLHGDNGEMGEC